MSATQGNWIDRGRINIADPTITDGDGHSFTDTRGLFVIHAVLLHTGKVLWFCGHVEDGHYALKSYLYDYKNPAAQLASQDFPLHNPSLARAGRLADPHAGPHADLFCCHFAQAPDGKVVVVGGSDPDYFVGGGGGHGSVGEPYIYTLDPATETWDYSRSGSGVNRLAEGRWYPTAVTLGDGRILVVSGRRSHGATPATPGHIAEIAEVLTPPALTPATLTGSDNVGALPIYPGLHLAPDGRVYYTHTTWGLEVDTPATTISLAVTAGSNSASWTTHAGVAPSQPRREEGMSVLLPPAQDGKILLVGGTAALDSAGDPTVRNAGAGSFDHIHSTSDGKKAEVLDTSGASPSWSSVPDLHHSRINGHCVILPDATVLILGGHDNYKWNASTDVSPTNPSLRSEIFDPVANTFTEVASLNHPRMYHSAAVLLPDGSVLAAGGADANEGELANSPGFTYPAGWTGPTIGGGMPFNRKDHEVYQPTYFFRGARPTITRVAKNGAETTLIEYGADLTVTSPEAGSIAKAALLRPGAATHHTDTEQRYVEISFTRSGNDLTLTMPTNRSLAPPGYYMVWIVDTNGLPCAEAPFVRLSEPPPAATTPSTGGGLFDCVVVTAAAGTRTAPEVLYLQGLRRSVAQRGRAGRRFIAAVNRLYYAVAPSLARRMVESEALREAVRTRVVAPAVRVIRATERRLARRPGCLVAALAAEGAVGIALLPVLAVAVGLRALARRPPPAARSGGGADG